MKHAKNELRLIFLKKLSTKCVNKSYITICICIKPFGIKFLYAIKPNQIKAKFWMIIEHIGFALPNSWRNLIMQKTPWPIFSILFWRCPRCNGYRRRKRTRRHEFKSWTKLIAFHIALIPLGKVWIQLFSIQLWVNSRADWVLQPWWGN